MKRREETMPKLSISGDNGKNKEIPLPPQNFHIGRNEKNDLVLPDKTVSRQHARLLFNSDLHLWQIENLSTTNPVFHNDKQLVKPSLLFDQDVIEIGIYTLTFADDERLSDE
ncbi:MAG: FHA domain-containing protein [Calditrichaeota bacterium]|nr:MAG: FHA domain-containing protein [Calditrichota bacterium]